ncbi:MAG: dihydrodipicolinate synthase family protein, partial [Gemmatimonadota bacterium]
VVPLLALGGVGVITVLGNVAPSRVSRMVYAFLEGDVATAREIQLRFLPLIHELFATSNPIPIKAAVAWRGFEVGDPRPPLVPLTDEARERLAAALREAGLRPAATEAA